MGRFQKNSSNSSKHRSLLSSLLWVILTLQCSSLLAADQPKLVVQITVDALRGDLPERFPRILGDGGFRYLMKEGIHYRNAHYQHANNETIVGHASLATGTVPAVHGMVANVWFDQEHSRLAYNIEDPNYHLLTASAGVDQKSEIDYTQKTAKADGRSPNNILTSTFSDELAAHYAGRSKIFAISVKDRGAVSLAGHAGKAFWFSKSRGEFVTSNYYYDDYPDWVDQWNARKPALAYANQSWSLLLSPDRYTFSQLDDQDHETDFPGFGRTFPHPYGDPTNKYFTTKLTLSPAGDELTLDFAKALVEAEGLGNDDVPDFLAISFSSTDYVGHLFGASSLETEDNIARLDRTLEQLFSFIDQKVGLNNTLIVLSADHGQPEVPGYLNKLGIHQARHFDVAAIDKNPIIENLKEKLGIGKNLVEAYFHPYLYLNRQRIHDAGLSLEAVEEALVEELTKINGVAYAISSSALRSSKLANTTMNRSVLNNFHPKRSGDIYLVLNPNVFINDFDGLTVASSHGAPWRYDTYVPIFFAGTTLQNRTLTHEVTPYDIAPTLSAYLGIKPPSGAVGNPLQEVLQFRHKAANKKRFWQ